MAPPAPVSDTSAFCQSGSAALMTGSSGGPKAQVDQILQKCKKGDVIQIPTGGLFAVSTLCDFSRAIVAVAGGSVACVLLGKERPIR